MAHTERGAAWVLATLLLLGGCEEQPAAEETAIEQLPTVNVTSDSVPARVDFTAQNARLRTTLARRSCTEWKLRADSLHEAMLRASVLLEPMRESLERFPLANEKVADSIYLAKGDGERLYHELRAFYTVAVHSAADTATLRRTENRAMQVLRFPTAEAWRQMCFARLPRVSTSTILSKISTDMLLLENGCLHSILKECERSVGGSPFPVADSAQLAE